MSDESNILLRKIDDGAHKAAADAQRKFVNINASQAGLNNPDFLALTVGDKVQDSTGNVYKVIRTGSPASLNPSAIRITPDIALLLDDSIAPINLGFTGNNAFVILYQGGGVFQLKQINQTPIVQLPTFTLDTGSSILVRFSPNGKHILLAQGVATVLPNIVTLTWYILKNFKIIPDLVFPAVGTLSYTEIAGSYIMSIDDLDTINHIFPNPNPAAAPSAASSISNVHEDTTSGLSPNWAHCGGHRISDTDHTNSYSYADLTSSIPSDWKTGAHSTIFGRGPDPWTINAQFVFSNNLSGDPTLDLMGSLDVTLSDCKLFTASETSADITFDGHYVTGSSPSCGEFTTDTTIDFTVSPALSPGYTWLDSWNFLNSVTGLTDSGISHSLPCSLIFLECGSGPCASGAALGDCGVPILNPASGTKAGTFSDLLRFSDPIGGLIPYTSDAWAPDAGTYTSIALAQSPPIFTGYNTLFYTLNTKLSHTVFAYDLLVSGGPNTIHFTTSGNKTVDDVLTNYDPSYSLFVPGPPTLTEIQSSIGQIAVKTTTNTGDSFTPITGFRSPSNVVPSFRAAHTKFSTGHVSLFNNYITETTDLTASSIAIRSFTDKFYSLDNHEFPMQTDVRATDTYKWDGYVLSGLGDDTITITEYSSIDSGVTIKAGKVATGNLGGLTYSGIADWINV